MTRHIFTVAVFTTFVAVVIAYPPPSKDAPKPDLDKQAKEAADTFCQNIIKKDIDALIKASDFPLMFEGGKNFEKAEDFRAELEKIPKELLAGIKITVKETITPEKLEEWGKAQASAPRVFSNADRLKEVKERVGKEGRVVAMEAEHNGQKEDRVGLILVKFKDGKPYIVGLAD